MDVLEKLPGSKDHTLIIKGKRTKRHRPPSPCSRVVISSSSGGDAGGGGKDGSSEGGGRNGDNGIGLYSWEDEDMANCLILLAQGGCMKQEGSDDLKMEKYTKSLKNGFYLHECKTYRSFPSFQALGGHRASHKKPRAMAHDKKSIFTTSQDYQEEEEKFGHDNLDVYLDNKILKGNDKAKIQAIFESVSSKIHECAICGSEFSSGQALGGHMRRHRNSTSAKVTITDTIPIDSEKPRNFFPLDLNLPAPEDDHRDLKLRFGGNQQDLVFSASALVDCHY